ncbi:MAG: hypothetical protein H0Z24_03470 [Thermosipho sp. (in: Bacteria)]|nr:hypothetical protein [Thermosipho sp. (in: thermotogales)]
MFSEATNQAIYVTANSIPVVVLVGLVLAVAVVLVYVLTMFFPKLKILILMGLIAGIIACYSAPGIRENLTDLVFNITDYTLKILHANASYR